MTKVEIAEGWLRVEILGWHKLWAFKSRLDFPLEHLVEARCWSEGSDQYGARGIRAPGTYLPGVIVAGTYHKGGKHIFYDVHDFNRAIVLEFRDEWYARAIVEVPDPEMVLGLIHRAYRICGRQ
jgi:hypothetical protein